MSNEKPSAELLPRPEYLGCNEGYVFRADPRLPPSTAQLYGEDGRLLATVHDVKSISLAPLPRR